MWLRARTNSNAASVSEGEERTLPTVSAPEPATRDLVHIPAKDSAAPQLLTIQDVCNRLNLSRTTIWRLMNQHGLKFIRIGGARRIRECDLESWLEKHTVSLSPASSETSK